MEHYMQHKIFTYRAPSAANKKGMYSEPQNESRNLFIRDTERKSVWQGLPSIPSW